MAVAAALAQAVAAEGAVEGVVVVRPFSTH
jgi:hypothetical protein